MPTLVTAKFMAGERFIAHVLLRWVPIFRLVEMFAQGVERGVGRPSMDGETVSVVKSFFRLWRGLL